MRDAKQITKQRLLDETSKSATEGEETAASAEPEDAARPVIPRIDIGDDDEKHEAPGSGRRDKSSVDSKKESPTAAGQLSVKTPRSSRMFVY